MNLEVYCMSYKDEFKRVYERLWCCGYCAKKSQPDLRKVAKHRARRKLKASLIRETSYIES